MGTEGCACSLAGSCATTSLRCVGAELTMLGYSPGVCQVRLHHCDRLCIANVVCVCVYRLVQSALLVVFLVLVQNGNNAMKIWYVINCFVPLSNKNDDLIVVCSCPCTLVELQVALNVRVVNVRAVVVPMEYVVLDSVFFVNFVCFSLVSSELR